VRYLVLYIIIWGAFSAFSQRLETYIDKDSIEVGEPLRLIFSIEQDHPIDTFSMEKFRNVFPAREMTYNEEGEKLTAKHDLEIFDSAIDTFYQENDFFYFKRLYTLSGWDSALVIIPPQQISFPDSNLLFPPVMFEVTMPRADPSIEIYDIAELFTDLDEDKESWTSFLLKWGWIPLLLVIVFVFLLIKSKKKKVVVEEKSLRERMLEVIDQLLKSELYEKDLKGYYVELSLLLRQFLSENYNMSFTDKTTKEIMQILNGVGVKFDTRKEIDLILNQSDLVKYAKSKPPIADVFIITEKAKTIIEELAPIELPKINE
jgi:hypothetical protein